MNWIHRVYTDVFWNTKRLVGSISPLVSRFSHLSPLSSAFKSGSPTSRSRWVGLLCHLLRCHSVVDLVSPARGFPDLSACQQDRPRSEEEGRRRGGYIGTAAGVDNNTTPGIRTGKYFRQRAEDLNIWMNRKRRENLRIGRNRASEGQVSALASWNGCGACVPTKATEEAQIFLSSATG